jgi:hypothetical protein
MSGRLKPMALRSSSNGSHKSTTSHRDLQLFLEKLEPADERMGLRTGLYNLFLRPDDARIDCSIANDPDPAGLWRPEYMS